MNEQSNWERIDQFRLTAKRTKLVLISRQKNEGKRFRILEKKRYELQRDYRNALAELDAEISRCKSSIRDAIFTN